MEKWWTWAEWNKQMEKWWTWAEWNKQMEKWWTWAEWNKQMEKWWTWAEWNKQMEKWWTWAEMKWRVYRRAEYQSGDMHRRLHDSSLTDHTIVEQIAGTVNSVNETNPSPLAGYVSQPTAARRTLVAKNDKRNCAFVILCAGNEAVSMSHYSPYSRIVQSEAATALWRHCRQTIIV